MPAPAPLLALSLVLNVLLIFALLAHQQFDTVTSTTRVAAASTASCPPRPSALAGAEEPRTLSAISSSPQPAPSRKSSAAAVQAVVSAAAGSEAHEDDGAYAVDEHRLKQLWWHPPHPKSAPPRFHKLEVHDARWAFLDDRQVARGLSTVGDPQRLRCLGEKLLDGLATHLSVLGGSVSFGTTFTTSRSKALFHWKVYQYVNASFPGVPHEHFMGAVPASGPSYMEHCVMWHLPPTGADLILVEYAVNFDSVHDDAPAFERLIRRLLRLPNAPAVVIVNTMEAVPPGGRLPWEPDDGTTFTSERDLQFHYRSTGAEDAIHEIADYYGVPCVSLRGAVFSEVKANSSRFPLRHVYHDRHHPSAWGHSLMAQMVAHLIHDAVVHAQAARRRQATSLALAPSACAVAKREQAAGPPLWAPLFSRAEAATVGTCAKDRELEAQIHSAAGFRYLIEGTDAKMKPGIIGMHPGDTVQFCIDVARLPVGSAFVFILGHLISYEHMGVAAVRCLDECDCGQSEVDAHVPGGKFSVFKAKTFHATRKAAVAGAAAQPATCGCKVQLTILPRTGSGEHKFKVLTLMTATKEGSLRYGHQAGFNNRPMEARYS